MSRRFVGVLALTETVSWGVLYYAFAVLQVPMRAELGLSAATTAGAFSVAVLVTGITAVPVGRWIDRRGARGLMTTGSVGAVLLVVAWSRVESVLGLYAVFAGVGVVSAMVLYEPAFAVVVRWCAADRSRALLAITLVAGFASTIFLPLADLLVRTVGWRDALLVLAAVLAVTTVLPHWLALPVGAGPGGVTVPATVRVRTTAGWAVRDRTFQLLTLAFAANTLAVIVVAVHLVPYLREAGHSATFAAVATGALGALSVTGRIVVTGAARRWPVAAVTSVAFAAQGVGVVVLLLGGRSAGAAVVFVLLFGLGFGVGTIARPALLAEAFGTRDYATLSALGGIAFTAAKTLGPFAAGLTRTVTGSYAPVLLALVTVCALAAWAVARAGTVVEQPADDVRLGTAAG